MKLNPRQEKFCIEYAKTGNATTAYQSAGFQSKSKESAQANSARLLADERIQERLRGLAEKTESESIASVAEIQRGLTKIFRGETTSAVVTKDGKVVEVPVSVKDKLKAAEILAKTHGAFLTRQEMNISQSLPVIIRDNI